MLVFGLGSGGCGLAALSRLLQDVPDSVVTKELLIQATGWTGSVFVEIGLAKRANQQLRAGASLAGDVAWYHLPYCWEIGRRYPAARFVCLQREREACIDSLVTGHAASHPYLEHTGHPFRFNPTQHSWPSMGVGDLRTAVGLYYDHYYAIAEAVRNELPGQFEILPTSYLDSPLGRTDILMAAGAIG